MLEFDRTSIIGEVVAMAPQVIPMFEAIGMHCFMCAAAAGETIEEACMVHDVDVDLFLEKLNKVVAQLESEA